jgi:hypothetical protein
LAQAWRETGAEIFSEAPFGQVFACFLRGDGPNNLALDAFHKSPLFGRKINPHHLYSWLPEVATTTMPATLMATYQDAINAIADGVGYTVYKREHKQSMA